jgi:hypothetical protein
MGSSDQAVRRERRSFRAAFMGEAIRLVAARSAPGATLAQMG